MSDIIISVRRTPCTRFELYKNLKRLLEKGFTLKEIAETTGNEVIWLKNLLEEFDGTST